jgi:deoxyribonuclease V
MKIKRLHSWDLSYKEAVALQNELAGEVRFTPLEKRPKLIAGLDCAFSRDEQRIIAAAVLVKIPEFEIIETVTAVRKLVFPYIPGLLSFREAPACIAAVGRLKREPDVFIVDGQGVAHPRRLGLASHLGLFFDRPTVGCAKSRLTGSFEELAFEKGSYSLLEDKNETIGAVLRSRRKVKPVFVSVGTKCTLEDAIRIVLACTTRYRLPEPTRLAHQLVSKKRLL